MNETYTRKNRSNFTISKTKPKILTPNGIYAFQEPVNAKAKNMNC